MTAYDSRRVALDPAAYRIIDIVARRIHPRFFVIDARGEVIFHSPDVDPADYTRRVRAVLEAAEDGAADETVFEFVGVDTVLRIIRSEVGGQNHVAVFIERVKHRGSLLAAATRYRLTRREVEVLRLVVQSFTSAQIAERLYIAAGTVGDHVKSLMRKTETTKRSELIARVFDLDHDLQEGNVPFAMVSEPTTP